LSAAKKDRALTEEEAKRITEGVRKYLQTQGADAKIKYPENVVAVLNSGTDRKKTIASDGGVSD
jgi:hypothetical protein